MARKSSKKVEPEVFEDQVEVLEEEAGGGLGLDAGLIFTTTFLLLGAIVMVVMVLKNLYNAGPMGG